MNGDGNYYHIRFFRSLVKKGIPLPAAITFMTVTPVINPVVIISTYYAFGGNMTVVIGRSFANQFPMGAIMGFLVFGPMMDLKNAMMLHSGFTKRFIVRLLFTTFLVCLAVVYLLSGFGGYA